MPSLLELKEVEKLIETVASQYGASSGHYEDYLHEGRVIAWEFILEHGVTKENLSEFSAKLATEVTKGIKRVKGVDIYGSMKEVSLDATFGPDSDGTLKDVIPSNEATPLDQLLQTEILQQDVDITPALLK